MKIKIAHLYYDLLNLYGEQGNITALEKSFKNQGCEVITDKLTVGDTIKLKNYDFIYLGMGSFENLLIVLKDIIKYKKDFKTVIEKDKFIIATGSSHDLFGQYIEFDNLKYPCLEIFDYYSKKTTHRVVGETLVKYLDMKIIGFQNRELVMQNDTNHLFEIINGVGDNYKSNNEGYLYKNFYGTYLIGPLLIRNPIFTEYIVEMILKSKKITYYSNEDNLNYLAYNEYFKNFYNKKS